MSKDVTETLSRQNATPDAWEPVDESTIDFAELDRIKPHTVVMPVSMLMDYFSKQL